MNESPKKVEGTVAFSLAEQAQSVRDEFEAAWQAGLKGAAVPEVEAFLGSVPESDRARLRPELERIELDYRQRLARNDDTEFSSGNRDGGSAEQTGAPSPQRRGGRILAAFCLVAIFAAALFATLLWRGGHGPHFAPRILPAIFGALPLPEPERGIADGLAAGRVTKAATFSLA